MSTDRITRHRLAQGRDAPSPDGLATYAQAGNAYVLDAVDARAQALGLIPGLALADARARRPGLCVLEADARADAAALERIAHFCERWTPSIVLDGRDGLLLEISATAHLFGGEAALAGEITRRLGEGGYAARVGLADTPQAAWAMAHFAQVPVAPPGETGEALAPLPIAGLRLDDGAAALLARLGLTTIGALTARARAPFAARAGERAQRRLDEALGRVEPALVFRHPPPPIFVVRRFLEPLVHADALMIAALDAAEEAAGALELKGIGARRLCLNLFAVSGRVQRLVIGFSAPERVAKALVRPFRERLHAEAQEDDLEFGVEAIRLDVVEIGRFDAAADVGEARLVDALSARLGAAQVRRLAIADRHWPERAGASNAALDIALPVIDAPRAARPLKLLARPEPVEAIAPVPDGPPRRFRWRRVVRDVARAEGPERIAAEWARMDGMTRDYFHVEDVSGARYWLFREGLYGQETDEPRWFVHGLFA